MAATMNGIESITERILNDARIEAEAACVQANAEAEQIAAAYALKAKAEYEAVFNAGKENDALRVQRLVSTSQMKAKREILERKQECIAQAFDRAVQKLTDLSGEEYIDFLARLAAAAARSGNESVVLNERDRQEYGEQAVVAANLLLVKKGIPGFLSLSEQVRPMLGGLIVKDGDIEVNCSIDTLMVQLRGSMTGEVAAALFD